MAPGCLTFAAPIVMAGCMISAPSSRRSTAAMIFLVISLCTIYMVSQFLRNSVGVIAPDLSADLNLSPENLGLLSGIFFLSFAAAQIPLGMALDRYGPRAVMLSLSGVAIVACLWFSIASDFRGLTGARMLMGLGCSSFFMAPLLIYVRMFSPARFATLTGIQLGLGSLGTLAATAPLAYISAAYGWRSGFVIVAVATALAALMVAIAARGRLAPPAHHDQHQTLRDSFKGVIAAIRQKDTLRLFVLNASGYPVFATMLGLWGAPYLSDIHGLGLTERGNVLFVMAACQITGLFLWGVSDRLFHSRKIPILIGGSLTTALLCLFALWPEMPLSYAAMALAALGLSCSFTPVITAHGKSLFPAHLTGRGLTFMNIGSMGGAFVLQGLTGLIIGLFPPTASGGNSAAAYQAGFATLAVIMVSALIVYSGARDTTPND